MAINGLSVTPNSITMIVDGDTQVLTPESHSRYDEIRAALRDKDYETAETLVNLVQVYENHFEGTRVELRNGVVYLDGEVLHGTLADRILSMADEGFDVAPMCRFVENLHENPSKRAVDELFGFLEATDLPITEDGNFLAYKMVRPNYTDWFSGKMDNSVGARPKMARNRVDEDKNRTCSAGLHFCSQGYLGCYGGSGGRTMILKINPAHVVAIPADYNNAKGRASEYEIVGELEGTPDGLRNHSFATAVADNNGQPAATAKWHTTAENRPPVTGTNRGVPVYRMIGNTRVCVDGEPSMGDLVYKKRAAKLLHLTTPAASLDLLDQGVPEGRLNDFDDELVIWDPEYYTLRDVEDWNCDGSMMFTEPVQPNFGSDNPLYNEWNVCVKGRPNDGDLVYKRRFREIMGYTEDYATLALMEAGELDTDETESGTEVVVWRDDYPTRAALENWDEIINDYDINFRW